ncbi:MAG: hypothetical protein NDJ24_03385 [Alphaproteobacteria bacterium]|nr:hypothetical protein [Alphaproteobacteria bacterium]
MKKPLTPSDKFFVGILVFLTLLFWGRGVWAIVSEYYSSNARWMERFELHGAEAQWTGGAHIFIGFIVLSALLMHLDVNRKISRGLMAVALLGAGTCFGLSLFA